MRLANSAGEAMARDSGIIRALMTMSPQMRDGVVAVQVEDHTHDERADDSRRNRPPCSKAQDSADGPGAEHDAADGATHGNQAAEADAEHQREGQRGPDRFDGHDLKVQQGEAAIIAATKARTRR